MNEVTNYQEKSVATLQEVRIDETTMAVLKETIYPGAKDQSIKMVINYCMARRIDPLLRAVHIVPMSVKTDKKNGEGKWVYETRDVIMPGIALYRIDATRTGQYAGMSEPEFGKDITETLGKITFKYPEWCKITVKKIVHGQTFEFVSKEYWKENYATMSSFDPTPNMIWKKRPYGQIAKCAEAQALRKAFPDVLGAEYTHEEMEGKTLVNEPKGKGETIDHVTGEVRNTESKPRPIKSKGDYEDTVLKLEHAENLKGLQDIFVGLKEFTFTNDEVKKIIDLKDIRKSEILAKEAKETASVEVAMEETIIEGK